MSSPGHAATLRCGPSTVDGNGFPRQLRLLKPAEFKRVFERPIVSSDKLFRVLARANEGQASRLGMGVSRKVDPRATVRNRIKRVIRENFRLSHPIGPHAENGAHRPGRDYVVLAARPSAMVPNERLSESLSRHWREIERKFADEAGANE